MKAILALQDQPTLRDVVSLLQSLSAYICTYLDLLA